MSTAGFDLPVLMYHRVVNKRSEAGHHNIYVKRKNIIKHFTFLKNKGYQTITFKELSVNPNMDITKKVILTFDDGYMDNYTLLFPLLQDFGFKAVIFLVTQLKRNEWGIVEGEPVLSLMDSEHIKEMDAYGIEFGGHTQTHPDLSTLAEKEIKQQVIGCKKDIEGIINKEVISFAYPFGGFNDQVMRITAEAGYKYGISTNKGPKNFKENLMQIRRIEVSCKTTFFSFKRKVSGHYYKK